MALDGAITIVHSVHASGGAAWRDAHPGLRRQLLRSHWQLSRGAHRVRLPSHARRGPRDHRDVSHRHRGDKSRRARVQASNGKLYGISNTGGSHGAGSIFELSLDGKDFKVIYDYPHPLTGVPTTLLEGSDGNLYGIAQGGTNFARAVRCSASACKANMNSSALQPGVAGGCPCFMTLGSDGKFYGTSNSSAWVWDLACPHRSPPFTLCAPPADPRANPSSSGAATSGRHGGQLQRRLRHDVRQYQHRFCFRHRPARRDKRSGHHHHREWQRHVSQFVYGGIAGR